MREINICPNKTGVKMKCRDCPYEIINFRDKHLNLCMLDISLVEIKIKREIFDKQFGKYFEVQG